MNKVIRNVTTAAILSCIFAIASAGTAFGQQANNVEPNKVTANAPTSNVQTVNAQQSGAWNVGIDPAQNTVKVASTAANPVAVKVFGSGSARKAYQARAIINPTNNATQTVFLPIPAGKRLVIENVSAIARCPDGLKMEMNFFTYIDTNGDGVGDISDIVFHRIALADQGDFGGTEIFAANHQILAFADEQIGTQHLQLGVQARLSGSTTNFAQAQFTFTGYLEDLSEVQ